MKLNKRIFLLFAAFLMVLTTFTVPVFAEDEEDPCISAGTCEDTGIDDENPDEDIFTEEDGIVIAADGTSESMELEKSIDSEETGADLSAVNSGKVTLTVDKEEGLVEIYGKDTGVRITAERSGTVSISTNTIGSETLGLGIYAGEGTTVSAANDDSIEGDTAVDIVNDGGNVTVQSGDIDGTVGVSILTGTGTTTVETRDIIANGYGVVLFINDEAGEDTARAPKVTVSVKGKITDDNDTEPGEDDPGFEPDDPGDEMESKAADDLTPDDDEWWKDAKDDPNVWTEEEDWGTDDDWYEEEENGTFYSVENSTGVFINADVRASVTEVNISGGISMSYGNEVNVGNGSAVKVSVGENVETDYGNRIAASEDSKVEFSFGSDIIAGGKAIDTYTDSGTLTVDAAGDIIAADNEDGDHETVGIYTNSEGNGNTKITAGKGIKVTSNEKDYAACGISAANIGGNVTISVGENVTISGEDAVGIYVLNDPDGSAFGDDEDENEEGALAQHAADLPPVTTITINGNVTASGTKGGTGAEIQNQNGKTGLSIYGDLTGSEYGLDLSAYGTDKNSSFADILVTGTISGKKAGLVVNDQADNDGTADDNMSLTVWKITPSAGGIIARNEDGTDNKTVGKNIKYIVTIAEGYEDKIKAVDENGSSLPVSHGYYYAVEGQRVYLEGLNGFDLTEAYNGKNPQIPLSKDENGRFCFDAARGGGILLSPEKDPQPEPGPDIDPSDHIHFYRIGDLSWLYDVHLPATGFSASRVTSLTARPQGLSYGSTGLMLQIPQLDVSETIVTVPIENGSYPVEWLDRSVGLLEQSSLPGEGVTVLTGHNHLNTTETGPFLFIGTLEENDRIMITDADNVLVTYKVYGNYKIASDDFAAIADEVRENALVLITCEDESVDGGYLNRRVILAEPL